MYVYESIYMANGFQGDRDAPDKDVDATLFRTHHNWDETGGISATIIDAVAAIVGREPTSLQPLYEVVDPDALDDLLRSLHRTEMDGGGSVNFSYNGCEVTVDADGTITVDPVNHMTSGV